jgi:hypothetical protein
LDLMGELLRGLLAQVAVAVQEQPEALVQA